jgi:hypothetical protein
LVYEYTFQSIQYSICAKENLQKKLGQRSI